MRKRRSNSVLCIGNDPVLLNFRSSILKKCGWRVLTAGTGHEGVLQFNRKDVDAVVIDLDDDGAEAALITGELKRMKPEVPIVLLVTDSKTLAPGATRQANAVLAKSEENSRLLDVLTGLMPNRKT